MSKTILIVTDNLPEQINGVVTTYKNLEAQAVADGYNIVYLDPSRFPHINAPVYPEVKLSWVRKIGKKIKEIQPDHIHIATEGPVGLACRVWCDRKNLTYNTAYHTKFPEGIKKLLGLIKNNIHVVGNGIPEILIHLRRGAFDFRSKYI